MQSNASVSHGEGARTIQPSARRDPIAIVGIGCRFPGGAHDPDSLWQLLARGVDAISEVPSDRFNWRRFYDSNPNKAGKLRSRWGGFVQQRVELFDALFFGMSPREAEYLDPMQRWLLEVSWEALEDGGLVPEQLAGSDASVFIGGFTEDIKLLQMDPSNRSLLGPHAATGSAMTMLANRLSYFYDFRGPSVALDTACSSSLVAVHLACCSIWDGDSSFALAGGVNAMFRPEYTIAESKAGMLSPDGRSKAFDARANGYVRGEGAGIVVLMPLSRALADGHSVYAVIRGSAVNQDGRTNGITVPNGDAQQHLIRAACSRAGVSPAEIQYVEAHGTGTPVGDPIEVNALGTALGEGRTADARCWIGSLKTNMGHLEAAAGVAGLIKTALSLSRGAIPPHLHLQQVNPAIDFDALRLQVPRELTAWPSVERRLACVNSFGFGGTNAHVVLEAAPAAARSSASDQTGQRSLLFTLSARSEGALAALARAHGERLAALDELTAAELADLAYSMNLRRSQHEQRLALRADSLPSLRAALEAATSQAAAPGVTRGRRQRGAFQPVFVFTGMGPQWWGMGRELLTNEPVFRAAIEECDALFRALSGWSLLEEMTRDEGSSRMRDTEVAQPASFALQVGLDRWWRSLGITPTAVVGHSAGEVAAAYSAGVYSLKDAVSVIYHRSRLQQRSTGQGKLAAIGVSLEEAEAALRGFEGRISIAAVNGPRTLTVVGDELSLGEFLAPFEAKQVFVRRLQVDVPYHSHYMDPLREELLASLRGIVARSAHTPLFSTVTGALSDGREWDAEYWWRNVRHSVLFAKAVDALAAHGFDTFVEVGPHPVLASALKECFAETRSEPSVVASLRRQQDERATLLDGLAALYVLGAQPNWSALSGETARFVRLPTYPFQRDEHWAESERSRQDRLGSPLHELLGERAPGVLPRFECELDLGRVNYLADHVVRGNVVFPGAGYLEMMLAAAREQGSGQRRYELSEVAFEKALFLRSEVNTLLELVSEPNSAVLSVHSRTHENEPWSRHARAKVRALTGARVRLARPAWPDSRMRRVDVELCYRYLASLGLEYGPHFRGICELWTGELAAQARVELPPTTDAAEYVLHPALLDACFQVMLAATANFEVGELRADEEPRVYLPTSIVSLRVHAGVPRQLWVRTELSAFDERALTGDLLAYDESEELVLELRGVQARSLENLGRSQPKLGELFYDVAWEALPEPSSDEATTPGSWLVLGGPEALANTLIPALEARGQRCLRVRFGESFGAGPDGFTLNPAEPAEFQRLLAEAFVDGHVPWRGVVQLGPCADRIDVARAEREGPIALLHLLKALEGREERAKIWVLTQGVHSLDVAEATSNPLDAALWGLMRGIAFQEHPHRFGGIVDLAREPGAADIALLAGELPRDSQGEQLAVRNAQRFVARFQERPELAESHASVRFEADASYLITGGFGGLGMSVARWMAEHGARHLILMGRSGLPPRAEFHDVPSDTPVGRRVAFVRELEARGVSVHVASLDIADEAALTGFLSQYRREAWPGIRGVVHAAGLSEPRLLMELSAEHYARTLRPKVLGALLLDQHLHEPLDFFVLFSSVAGFAFTAGQGDYAAANAVLDALAHDRRRRGRCATSIDFGPWAEAGMATLLGDYFENRGMTPFAPELGLRALGRLIEHDATQATVLWISDRDAFKERNFSSSARIPFLDHILQQATAASSDAPPQSVISQLREAGAARPAVMLHALRQLLARVLRLQIDQVDPEASLNQLGLDSLLAVELKNRILTEFQVNLLVVELLREIGISRLSETILERLPNDDVRDAHPTQINQSELERRPLPLGPNQLWFFARELPNPHHWNMAALWDVMRPLDAEKLSRAVAALVAHHELLRARFVRSDTGWQQFIVPEEKQIPCRVVSLRDVPIAERDAIIEAHISERQAALDLFEGPLLDVTYFEFTDRPGRLLTVIHHLVSDVFSQQIVVADLELLYQQLERGVSPSLPARTAGFGDWVEQLNDYARRRVSASERRYWLDSDFPDAPLPIDFEDGRSRNSIRSARLLTASLSSEETRALTLAAKRSFGAHTLDILMTAFALSLRQWCQLPRVALDVIVHGREAPGNDLDLGRTVGLFAHGIPLSLALPDEASLEDALARIRTQLAPFQADGRTFAALRWLSHDAELVNCLANLPKRELIFNYIGQFESSHDDSALFRVVPSVPRALESADNQRDFLLQCQVGILNGELTLLLNYSENVHRTSTIERLAASFLGVLRAFLSKAGSTSLAS